MESEFAELCERSGTLKQNIPRIAQRAGEDPVMMTTDYAVVVTSMVATTLTSYANAMGDKKEFREAKGALDLALLLKPRHRPAWSSMAMLAYSTEDYRAAVSWADKVLSFESDPNTRDPWETAAADAITPELQNLMRAIKEACRSVLGRTR